MVRSGESDSSGDHTPPLGNLKIARKKRTKRSRSFCRSRSRISRRRRRSSSSIRTRSPRYRDREQTGSHSKHRRVQPRTRRSSSSISSCNGSKDRSHRRTHYEARHRHSGRRSHHRLHCEFSSSSSDDVRPRKSKSNVSKSPREELKQQENAEISVLRKLIDLMADKHQNSNSTVVGAQNVIPAFDPSLKHQTAKDWIRKVNEIASIYNWQEKQTIYYALPKLSGLAKRWYEGLSSVDLTWAEWEEKILSTFPDDRNYGDKLAEMLDRKSRREESLEEYYHDKMCLIQRCKITGRDAVDCVIHGLYDYNIRLNAQGSGFQNPQDLLKFLRSVSSKNISQPRRSLVSLRHNNNYENRSKSESGDTVRPKVTKCYNCSEIGHTVLKCPKPTKRCSKCLKLGHEQEQCHSGQNITHKPNAQTPSSSHRILKITTSSNKKDDKYFKSIKVNGSDCTAYVDFGSQCSLITKRVADTLNLIISKHNLPVIKGFASGSVGPIGRVSIHIKIDAVVADIEAYVVEDYLLNTDALIGQSLTELPTVVVYKTSQELHLYTDESHQEKVPLYSSGYVSVIGTQTIAVHTDSDLTSQVCVSTSICMKGQHEYVILQGIYLINNGQGHIVVTNLSGKEITFDKDMLLSRAQKMTSSEPLSPLPQGIIAKEINLINTDDRCNELKTEESCITMAMIDVGKNVSEPNKVKLLNLLNKYRECFALSSDELGLTPITEMHIKLADDTPVSYKPYRLPFAERKVVRDMVDELLTNEVITESTSPYASPIVLVRKKDNQYRLCIDYRALNKKTIKDHYPMPVIDDQLDRLSGKRFFTSLDLASGYHQIPVAEGSRHLTAFITPDGHYEYTRMPFGLVNAPAVFQQMINKALGSRRFELAIPYLDDLLTAAEDENESLQKLEEILILLRKANLTLNINKCHFLQSSVDYLGYEISEDGLKPGARKTQAVSDFPTPSNIHQVRQFIGLASFFRRFVCNFASIAKPLTKLTKSDVPWNWGPEQEGAFQEIKSRLVSRPILALYNPEYVTEVHCDASKLGMGAILLQKPDNKSPPRAVAYYSRQTTRDEEFFHSYELETMAVVSALKKFRIYLIGLHFTVITDCNALRATLSKRDLIPRIARWWLQLQEFDFTVEYRPGQNMKHADALSRNPVLMPEDNQDSLEIMNIRTEDWLHTVQMTDSKLKHIKDILEAGEANIKEITNNYVLKNNRVYRRVNKSLRWVVPHGARWRICQLCHDEAGHFAFDKTFEKVQSEYWFPKMKRFIKKYVAACLNCAYNKKVTGKKTGYLHPIPKTSEIFHTIHMDHLGPFVKSKRGNMYILGVIDGFSKFIFIRAVRNTKSRTTIKVLEDIFAIFGSPKVIISDQGTSFTSAEFKRFVDGIGSKHVLNAVATPRANGQIERYNRTILSSLAALNHNLHEADWDLNISKLQWSLNNTINRGTGKLPAEIVFGQRTTNPSEGIIRGALNDDDTLEEDGNTENIYDPADDSHYANRDRQTDDKLNGEANNEKKILSENGVKFNDRSDIRREADLNIKSEQTKMKNRFDKKRAPTKVFKEGDLVMIPNYCQEKGKSNKLTPKFRGPFKVVTVLENDRYEVSNIEGHASRKYINIFPADHLKPWITFNSSPTDSDSNDSSYKSN